MKSNVAVWFERKPQMKKFKRFQFKVRININASSESAAKEWVDIGLEDMAMRLTGKYLSYKIKGCVELPIKKKKLTT